MPTSGLVVTLNHLDALQPTLARLRRDERFGVGEVLGLRIPVVLSTERLSEGSRQVDAMQLWPGVAQVDVVAIDFSDAELEHGPT
jgi:hypothetical protein